MDHNKRRGIGEVIGPCKEERERVRDQRREKEINRERKI